MIYFIAWRIHLALSHEEDITQHRAANKFNSHPPAGGLSREGIAKHFSWIPFAQSLRLCGFA
jgi:hypothetical protein